MAQRHGGAERRRRRASRSSNRSRTARSSGLGRNRQSKPNASAAGTNGQRAEFRAENIEERGIDGSAFDFVSPSGRARLELPLIGRHNVMNAVAALAAASIWGIGAADAKKVFPALTPADKRGEVVRFAAGFTVINDTYNSSPTALNALADLLAATPGYRRKILAAGEMRELGPSSPELHRECGASIAQLKNIDWILGVTGDAAQFVEAATKAPATRQRNAKFFADSEEAGKFFAEFIQPGDLLLLKGSRGVKMEKILEAIDARPTRAPNTTNRECTHHPPSQRLPLMLYYLFYFLLRPHFSPLNVFRYITVRTAVASISALLLSLLMGPWVIDRLRSLQVKQYIREEGPKAHQKKAGTPTMGGVLIVASIVIPTLLWADLRNAYVLLAIGATVAFGTIGFVDDYNKVVRKRNYGPHSAREIRLSSAHLFRRRHRAAQPAGTWRVFHAAQRSVFQTPASESGHHFALQPSISSGHWRSSRYWCFWFWSSWAVPTPSISPTASTAWPSAACWFLPPRSPCSLIFPATRASPIISTSPKFPTPANS